MEYMRHFERNPQICGGEPVIKGTRVPVKTILASLASGDSAAAIRKDFPVLQAADVRAVIMLAAQMAGRRLRPEAFPKAS